MIAGHFSNYYFDLGEKYGVKFVRAQCDKIASLKDYKDRSQPTFLFYLVRSPLSRAHLPFRSACLTCLAEWRTGFRGYRSGHSQNRIDHH